MRAVDEAPLSDMAEQSSETAERLPYEAPVLICHGTVEDLVATTNTGPTDGPNGQTVG
jgi:hypothetical protein